MAINHILIVDDAETIREMLQDYLLSSGFSVDCAETAEEAYKKLKERKPDLILLDVVLPDMLGTDLCVQIKSKKDYKFIPIIMCSANAISTQDKMKGFDIGADDYVTKPFVLDELNSRIRALLRRVEMDKTRHVQEEQAAQQAAAAPAGGVAGAASSMAVETKVEEPPLNLVKYFGYSFISPKKVYANILAGSGKLNILRLILFLAAVSFFPAIPQIIQGETKVFFSHFFNHILFFGLFLALSALVTYAVFQVIFKKKQSYPLLLSIMQVAILPFLLYKILAFVFVLAAGYEAEVSHFSAGVGLFLPMFKSKFINILVGLGDLFPILSMISAGVGLGLVSQLPLKKILPISVAAISLSYCIVSFLP